MATRIFTTPQRPHGVIVRTVGREHHEVVAQREHLLRTLVIAKEKVAVNDNICRRRSLGSQNGAKNSEPIDGGGHIRVRVAALGECRRHDSIGPWQACQIKSWT